MLSSSPLLPPLDSCAAELCDSVFRDGFSSCRARAKRSRAKRCIFLALERSRKESLRQRGTLCLQGTERQRQGLLRRRPPPKKTPAPPS